MQLFPAIKHEINYIWDEKIENMEWATTKYICVGIIYLFGLLLIESHEKCIGNPNVIWLIIHGCWLWCVSHNFDINTLFFHYFEQCKKKLNPTQDSLELPQQVLYSFVLTSCSSFIPVINSILLMRSNSRELFAPCLWIVNYWNYLLWLIDQMLFTKMSIDVISIKHWFV